MMAENALCLIGGSTILAQAFGPSTLGFGCSSRYSVSALAARFISENWVRTSCSNILARSTIHWCLDSYKRDFGWLCSNRNWRAVATASRLFSWKTVFKMWYVFLFPGPIQKTRGRFKDNTPLAIKFLLLTLPSSVSTCLSISNPIFSIVTISGIPDGIGEYSYKFDWKHDFRRIPSHLLGVKIGNTFLRPKCTIESES